MPLGIGSNTNKRNSSSLPPGVLLLLQLIDLFSRLTSIPYLVRYSLTNAFSFYK